MVSENLINHVTFILIVNSFIRKIRGFIIMFIMSWKVFSNFFFNFRITQFAFARFSFSLLFLGEFSSRAVGWIGQHSRPGACFGDTTHAIYLDFLGSCRCFGKSGRKLFRFLDAQILRLEGTVKIFYSQFLKNSDENFPPSSKQDPFIPSSAVLNTCSMCSNLA